MSCNFGSGSANVDTANSVISTNPNYPPSRLRGLKPFRPGQSGNPSGRPKSHKEMASRARELGLQALDIVARIAKDEQVSAAARIRAAKVILDRAFGKVPDGDELDDHGSGINELEEIIRAINEEKVAAKSCG